jgi:hypothetical protein
MNHEPQIERRMVKDLLDTRILKQGRQPGRPRIGDAYNSHPNAVRVELTRSKTVVAPVQTSGLNIPGNVG